MKERILIVEDDEDIVRVLKNYLERAGYIVNWASTGREGLSDFKSNDYDLVMIDLMMPEMDGFTLCKNIRWTSDVPIIIISAKNTDEDKVKGLKLGADDYITKPFSLVELEARVNSHLRRYRRYTNDSIESDNIIRFDNGLSMDKENKKVMIDNNEIFMTPKEFSLIELLADNPNKTFSKKELYEHIWNQEDLYDNNTVTVHIKEIRNKLKDNSKEPSYIQTVWGIGYKFIGKRIL